MNPNLHMEPTVIHINHQRAWEVDVEAEDENDGDGEESKSGASGPSEAFLSLQKDLEEKEMIQKENEERARNEEVVAAEAAKSVRRKVGERQSVMFLHGCTGTVLPRVRGGVVVLMQRRYCCTAL